MAVPPPNSNRNLLCWLFVVSAATSLGCGQSSVQLSEVSGKVTLDGKPLGEGTISFYVIRSPGEVREGPSKSIGQIKPDGTFALQTLIDGYLEDGGIVGTHEVRVTGDSGESKKPLFGVIKVEGETFVVEANQQNSFDIPLELDQLNRDSLVLFDD